MHNKRACVVFQEYLQALWEVESEDKVRVVGKGYFSQAYKSSRPQVSAHLALSHYSLVFP